MRLQEKFVNRLDLEPKFILLYNMQELSAYPRQPPMMKTAMARYELNVDPSCPIAVLQKRFARCLGFRLRMLRHMRGLHQVDLGVQSGLSKFQMHRIETGGNVHATSYADIMGLAAALNVSALSLIPRSTDLVQGWFSSTQSMLFNRQEEALRLALCLLKGKAAGCDTFEGMLDRVSPKQEPGAGLLPWDASAMPVSAKADLEKFLKADDRQDIQTVLKRVRESRGITIADLASRTRMNKHVLRDVEQASSTVAIWRVVAIARALHIDLATLFPDEGPDLGSQENAAHPSADAFTTARINRVMDAVRRWSLIDDGETRTLLWEFATSGAGGDAQATI